MVAHTRTLNILKHSHQLIKIINCLSFNLHWPLYRALDRVQRLLTWRLRVYIYYNIILLCFMYDYNKIKRCSQSHVICIILLIINDVIEYVVVVRCKYLH